MARGAPPQHVRTFTVRLRSPHQLFRTSAVDPMSPEYSEFTAVPALDTIRELVIASPTRHHRIRLVLELPASEVTPGLADELTVAIDRYLDVATALDTDAARASGPISRRLLLLSAGAFMVVQLTAIWVRNVGDATGADLLQALGEGLTVASWVLLWVPIQLLTVESWRSRLRSRRLAALRDPEVVLVSLPDRDAESGVAGIAGIAGVAGVTGVTGEVGEPNPGG